MKMSKLLATTALCMSLQVAGGLAAPITGSVAVNTTSITVSPPNIAPGSQVTYNGATFGSGTPFLDTIGGTPLTPSILTLTNGSTFTFTSAVGSFSGTNNVSLLSLVPGAGFLAIAQGTFTPAGSLAGFSPNTMFVTLSATQSGIAPAVSFSASFTMNSLPPPGLIPEPMSLALFGLGLAGLGVAARRRKD